MNTIPPPNASRAYSTIVGTLLIAIGITVLFEVLIRAKALFDDPQSFKAFLVLTPSEPAARTMIMNEQTILLPEAFFYYVSFGLPVVLLFVATMIGGIFVRRGVNLF